VAGHPGSSVNVSRLASVLVAGLVLAASCSSSTTIASDPIAAQPTPAVAPELDPTVTPAPLAGDHRWR
jgi:photosystem II stability/assembly factor-like uncharacterized protein